MELAQLTNQMRGVIVLLLVISSVLCSLGIAAFGLVQGLKLFGKYRQSIEQTCVLAKMFTECLDGDSLKGCLRQIQDSQDVVLRSISFRLTRLFDRDPIPFLGRRVWLVELDSLCDSNRLYKIHPSFEKVQSMPGLLTGVGILFTFVGLTLGIFGLDPTDADQLTRGVQKLLGGMSLAFLTTIAGIATALWWTWVSKSISGTFEAAISDLYKSLVHKPFLILPEEMNYQLFDYQEQQALSLAQLETTIINAIKKSMLETGLKQLLEPEAKADGRDDLGDVLGQIRDELGHLSSGFHDVVQGNRKLTELAEKLTLSQTTIAEQSAENLERQMQFVHQAQGLYQNVGKIHEIQGNYILNMTESMAEIRSVVENLHTASTDMSKHHTTMLQHIEQLDSSWKSYRDQLQGMLTALENGLTQFRSQLKDSVLDVHGEIDKLLASSLQHFSGALKGFDQTLETMAALLSTSSSSKKKESWLSRRK